MHLFLTSKDNKQYKNISLSSWFVLFFWSVVTPFRHKETAKPKPSQVGNIVAWIVSLELRIILFK